MKRICTISFGIMLVALTYAQSPEKMKYQAVIRNASNELVSKQQVGMQISILQESANGTIVYAETHKPSTNANGLVSIEIGTGTTSNDFSAIDWANGPYFLKTETDPGGGKSYSITGTSQLLSVPYALHAKRAESVNYSNGISLPYNFGPNPDFIGSQGNFIGFGHHLVSEDFIGYKNNTFYFKDSPGGGDVNDPDVIVGGDVGIGTENPKGKLHVTHNVALGNDIPGQMFVLHSRSNAQGEFLSITCDNGKGGWDWAKAIQFDRDGKFDVRGELSVNNNSITYVATPVNDQDAATKKYVDEHGGATKLNDLTDAKISGGSVYIGPLAGLLDNGITNKNNTALGAGAGAENTGNGNVFLGYRAGFYETGSNKLYINNSSGKPLIHGDFETEELTVNGSLDVEQKVKSTDSGDADLKAYIYGMVSKAGISISSASSNGFTASKISSGIYEIKFTGTHKPSTSNSYIVLATAEMEVAGDYNFAAVAKVTNGFRVFIKNVEKDSHTNGQFSFVVYKK